MRKGISPMLSVTILIGIAVLGGSVLYGIQNKFLESSLAQIDLRIVDLKIEKDAENSCYFQAKFYNSGTESINFIHVKTTMDNGEDYVDSVDLDSNGLVPGSFEEEFDFKLVGDPECDNFTVSNVYPMQVNASSADSAFSIIKPVKIENVN
jgi:hypothetical protein